MDNKLKNWADNFRPVPQEEVWNKIVVRKDIKPKPKLSLKPNVIIAACLVIAICILVIALNFLHIFRNNAKGQNNTKENIETQHK
jgi:hypothetical protein